MRYLIVDDEPLLHRIVADFCKQLPDLQCVGSAFDAKEGLTILNREPVDVVFLDVALPQLSGFDFLRGLTRRPLVIVISAHKEYALEGFELDVVDYLLKPFDLSRFMRAVAKARAVLAHQMAPPGSPQTIFIKDGKKQRQVSRDDLRWIESCGNYCQVHTVDGQFLTQETLTELARRLPGDFIRIHKSYLVSAPHLDVIEGEEVRMGSQRFPVGRVYRGNLQAWMERT